MHQPVRETVPGAGHRPLPTAAGGRPAREKSALYRWSVATFVAMFIANTLGFTDTVTGSAMGCGPDWPLCNGMLIPDRWNEAVVIEYTHRVSVMAAGIMLLILAAWAVVRHGRWREVRWLVGLSLGGVFAESALGALTVMFVNPPALLAAHLGVALWSFVGVFLLTVVIRQLDADPALQRGRQRQKAAPDGGPTLSGLALRGRRPQAHIERWAWFAVAYAYAAMYLGAYVASTGDGGMFQGWPFPTESWQAAGWALVIDILHRTVALGFVVLLVLLVRKARRQRCVRPDLYLGSLWALGLVLAQAASGGLLVASHLAVWAFVLHVTVVSFLFVSLCYLGLQVLPPSRAVTTEGAPAGHKTVPGKVGA
ncbi:MAG: COX15/CtaA family protein [Alicyclobacillus sp.]|nr:COX15/CtaA family protein [Alicyclobacillus sp.]